MPIGLLLGERGAIGKRMLRTELPNRRKRGTPKRRFMDVGKEDMQEVDVTEEDAREQSEMETTGPALVTPKGRS